MEQTKVLLWIVPTLSPFTFLLSLCLCLWMCMCIIFSLCIQMSVYFHVKHNDINWAKSEVTAGDESVLLSCLWEGSDV